MTAMFTSTGTKATSKKKSSVFIVNAVEITAESKYESDRLKNISEILKKPV